MNKKRNNAEQKQINPTNLRTVTLIMLSLLSSIPHVTPWSLLSPSQHICTKSTRSTFTLTSSLSSSSSSSLSRMLSIRRQQFTPSSSSQIILQQQSQASSSSTSSLETENSSLRDMIKQLEEENENLKKIQHQQQEIPEKQSTTRRNNSSNNNNKKIILETFEGEHMFDSLPGNNTNNMMMNMDGDNDDDELWCDSLDGDTCPLEPTLSFGEALRDRAVWLVGTFCS
jgi:gas vesicle protein